MSDPRILPNDLVFVVEQYVDKELADAERYDNRELLDESGIWDLHRIAAAIYSRGWTDGETAEASRQRFANARQRAIAVSLEDKP